LAFGQAVNVLLLADGIDQMAAHELRPVTGRVVVIEGEQGAHARVADEGGPAAFVKVLHLGHVLKHRDELNPICFKYLSMKMKQHCLEQPSQRRFLMIVLLDQ